MPFHEIIGHEQPKAILRTALVHDRLAHALLFHGSEGIGKRLVALCFAQAINCDTPHGPEGPDACGICRSCLQILAHTHPDFRVIEPDREAANPQIKIEQIRELGQHIIYRPLVGQWKVCLIDEADRLTLGAANALLKTLEEPPAYSLFILITSRPSALPATVRSRCQGIRFAAPARTQVEAALITKKEIPPEDARYLAVITQSRIGHALTLDANATRALQDEFNTLVSPQTLRSVSTLLTVAEALHKSDRGQEALEWIAQWVRDLILVRVGADPDSLLNLDRLPALQEAARGAHLDALLELHEDLDAMARAATRNLNPQMALENVLLRLRDALCAGAVSD